MSRRLGESEKERKQEESAGDGIRSVIPLDLSIKRNTNLI